jgi:hypothetical protein
MTYPLKFRKKVLRVREKEGLSIAAVAARFDVGVASVVRWLHTLEPMQNIRRRRCIDLTALQKDVEDHPDAYPYERAQRFGVAQSSMHRALGQPILVFVCIQEQIKRFS